MSETYATLLRQLVALAEKTHAALASALASAGDEADAVLVIWQVVDAADFAFAVWPDADAPHGVGCMLIKGNKRLRELVAEGRSEPHRITALACGSVEQAHALRAVARERERLARTRLPVNRDPVAPATAAGLARLA